MFKLSDLNVDRTRLIRFWGNASRFRLASAAPSTPVSRFDNASCAKLLRGRGEIADRSGVHQQLKKSEFRLHAIAEAVPGIPFSATRNGTIEYFNDHLAKYAGLSPLNVAKMDLVALVHADDRKLVVATALRAAVESRPASIECRLRAASGDYRWFLVRASPVQDGDDVRWFGIATDIDDIKRLSADLVDAHHSLESILGSISNCYVALDRDSRIVALNEHVERWFGKSTDSLIGADYRILGEMASLVADFPQDQLSAAQALNAAVEEAIHRHIPVQKEMNARHFPERSIDVQINPSKEGAVILFRNITERRLEQQRLRRLLGLVQSTLDALTARIIILDANGIIIAVNKAWRLFHSSGGVGGADMGPGANYKDGCEIPALRNGLVDVLNGKTSLKVSYELETETGRHFYQATVTAFKQSEFTPIVVAHEDVTEAVISREAIADLHVRLISLQEEERQRIASELHDSTAQYLVAASLDMSRLRKLVDSNEDAQHLCDGIDRLMEEALKELHTFTYLLYPTGLSNDGLKITLERFVSGLVERSALEVGLSIEKAVDEFPLDFQRAVLRITQEALANAHRHAAATRVDVAIAVQDKKLRLEISDNGRGMPHATTAEITGGVELGVGITGMKARVAQFGGTIEFPERLSGTTVVATIPIPEIHKEAHSRQQDSGQDPQESTIRRSRRSIEELSNHMGFVALRDRV